LTNLAGAAEGTNLPPRQQGGFRVPAAKGFKVLSTTTLSDGMRIVLTWDTPEGKANVNHYRIYTFNSSQPGTQPASATASAKAPVTLTVQATAADILVFRIQTVLNNGLTLPVNDSPSCAVTVGTPTWTAATLENSWVNFGSGYTEAAYYKDAYGFVHLHGTIKNGTTTDGTTILTLPAGFRPAMHCNFLASNNGNVASIVVTSTGGITIGGLTSATELSLNGIYFSIY
jgi:hypothetical protein